jgi:hypothetical protein
LAVGLLAGCSGEPAPEASDSAATSAARATESSLPTEPIARAASDFLDAVLAGDIQRASARLTPKAIQRIIGSGLQFQPAGQEKAAFRTGEVRMPTKTQALVQFVFTYTASDGSPKSEEGCCLMRLVDNDWRVSGLAYGAGANNSWTLSDFESGQMIPIARQSTLRTPADQPGSPATGGGRPSPPRTAQQAPAPLR